MNGSSGGTILVVEDDPHLGRLVARRLCDLAYEVAVATSFDEALKAAAELRPDDALLDMWIPGGNGIALIEPLRRLNPKMRIVLSTAYPSIANSVDAIRLGADDYLPKPVSVEQLRKAFARNDAGTDERREPEERPLSLARARWEYIQYVLRECGWNIAAAARRLRVHRQSLQRMLKKHPPA